MVSSLQISRFATARSYRRLVCYHSSTLPARGDLFALKKNAIPLNPQKCRTKAVKQSPPSLMHHRIVSLFKLRRSRTIPSVTTFDRAGADRLLHYGSKSVAGLASLGYNILPFNHDEYVSVGRTVHMDLSRKCVPTPRPPHGSYKALDKRGPALSLPAK